MDTPPSLPQRTQILVVGGGPAGSYAATLLARDGFEVTVIERDIFPRYHIGESLLPSVRQFLQLIDAEQLVESCGFVPKPGAAVKLNQYSREGYTDFTALDPNNKAWNVVRSEFDDVLLQHAAKSGVRVHQGTKILSINFDDQRPVSVDWETKSGITGTLGFDWFVDASGRAGLMSTQYLHNRKINESLKNIACWAYWSGGKVYARGTSRHNSPWFEALSDETGWSWYIPLHNGTVSVGFVMSTVSSAHKRGNATGKERTGSNLRNHYLEQLKFTPGLANLLSDARLCSDIKSASDYSYSASAYSGDHFRLAGDAGAFIDPFFSSGVHLAFTGALSAACTIAASIRQHCTEQEAQTFHDLKIGTAYTRFLIVVLSAYKQVNQQHAPVLQDLDEDSFDRAFDLLRPVLQGAADVGKELTENEVELAIEFCSSLFAPTTPEMHQEVMARLDGELTRSDAPILLKDEIFQRVGKGDEEALHVLGEINARKQIHTMYDVAYQFGHEAWAGLVPTCIRGALGLARVGCRAE